MSEASDTPLWFSSSGTPLIEEGLGFYEPDFDWVPSIEGHWEVIRKEIEAYIERHHDRIEPYFNKSMVKGKNKWRAFGFLFWSWSYPENEKECPKTMELLNAIPGLLSASVSILEPHTEIKSHRGDTNAVYRCHLGLKVPAALPDCGMRVSGEDKSWQEGKLLVFNDAAEHAAWNHSDETRYVLLFDVIRPEFVSQKEAICARVLTGIRMQMLRQNSAFVRRSPRFVRTIIASFLKRYILRALRRNN